MGPPISLHLIPFIRPLVIRTLWLGRLACNWEWSPSLWTALHDRKRASLPFWIISPFCFLFYCRGLARAGRRVQLCSWECVNLHLNATWLQFSIFFFHKILLIFQENFRYFSKSFIFFLPRNLNIFEIQILFSSPSGSMFYYLILAKLSQ